MPSRWQTPRSACVIRASHTADTSRKSGPSKGEAPLTFTWSVIAMTSPRFQGFRQPFAFVRTARLIPAATAARARAVTGRAPNPS